MNNRNELNVSYNQYLKNSIGSRHIRKDIFNILFGIKDVEQEHIEKIFISIEEARKILNIGRNTMLYFAHLPNFPAVFTGRKILIVKDELLPWAKANIGTYIS